MEGGPAVSAEAQKAYMYRIMGARIQRERMMSAQLSRRLQGEEDEEGEDDEEGYDSEQYPDSEPPLSFPVPAIDGLDGSKSAKPKEEKLDPKLVGMSVGFKNLYAGKEDRRGRFQWQETIPEDLVPPAENAETQKWAFVARYTKVSPSLDSALLFLLQSRKALIQWLESLHY